MFFNRPIGSHHSVTDILTYEDTFFYIFGKYQVRRLEGLALAECIMTSSTLLLACCLRSPLPPSL
jgi:hypothetical protein